MRTFKEPIDVSVLGVDTDEFYYFLGITAADANFDMSTFTPRYRLQIHIKDRQILEDISSWLKFERSVRVINKKDQADNAILQFSSNVTYQICKRYGIDETKTRTITSKFVPSKWFFSFLRGFMDGDGCISRGRVTLCCSRKEFLEEVLVKCNENSIFLKQGVTCNKGCYYLLFPVESSKLLINKLYKGASLYLQRKKEAAVEAFDKSGRLFVPWHSEAVRLYNEGKTTKEISIIVNHCTASVSAVLKKNGLGRHYKRRRDYGITKERHEQIL